MCEIDFPSERSVLNKISFIVSEVSVFWLVIFIINWKCVSRAHTISGSS